MRKLLKSNVKMRKKTTKPKTRRTAANNTSEEEFDQQKSEEIENHEEIENYGETNNEKMKKPVNSQNEKIKFSEKPPSRDIPSKDTSDLENFDMPLSSQISTENIPIELENQSLINKFIYNLYQVVCSPLHTSVTWYDQNCEQIIILDRERFTTESLPQISKTTEFAGFVRQMNAYGFRKVRNAGSSFLWGDSSAKDSEKSKNLQLTAGTVYECEGFNKKGDRLWTLRRKHKEAHLEPSKLATFHPSDKIHTESVSNFQDHFDRNNLQKYDYQKYDNQKYPSEYKNEFLTNSRPQLGTNINNRLLEQKNQPTNLMLYDIFNRNNNLHDDLFENSSHTQIDGQKRQSPATEQSQMNSLTQSAQRKRMRNLLLDTNLDLSLEDHLNSEVMNFNAEGVNHLPNENIDSPAPFDMPSLDFNENEQMPENQPTSAIIPSRSLATSIPEDDPNSTSLTTSDLSNQLANLNLRLSVQDRKIEQLTSLVRQMLMDRYSVKCVDTQSSENAENNLQEQTNNQNRLDTSKRDVSTGRSTPDRKLSTPDEKLAQNKSQFDVFLKQQENGKPVNKNQTKNTPENDQNDFSDYF